MRHPDYYDTDVATSKRMANVKLKGGVDEESLAKALWHKGFRYWRNYKKLPGSPDIALQKYHIAIFVDGEFWHGFDWEKRKQNLNRNREYWVTKIEENIARDRRVDSKLLEMDWTPVHFWSKDVKKNLNECVDKIIQLSGL